MSSFVTDMQNDQTSSDQVTKQIMSAALKGIVNEIVPVEFVVHVYMSTLCFSVVKRSQFIFHQNSF